MWQYLTKRIVHGIFVIWLVSSVVFVAVRLVPGGPVAAMLGPEAANPEAVERIEQQLGLHDPMYVQYFDYMTDLVMLDMGESVRRGVPVTEILANAIPMTLSIALVGMTFGIAIAIPAGIISATQRHSTSDYVATIAAFMGLSMPAFFIGILLMLVFAVNLGLLPSFGYTPLSEGIVPWFRSILLPGIAVGAPYCAVIMRMMRGSLLDVKDEQYMTTARAKGLSKRVALYKHALQNALIPVLTIGGIQLVLIITGSVTVEIVFAIDGLGHVVVDAIIDRDYPVVQGGILVIATLMVFINIGVDVLYTYLDPQIKYGGEA